MRVPGKSKLRGNLDPANNLVDPVKAVDNVCATQNSASPLNSELKELAQTRLPESDKGQSQLESSGIRLKIVTLVEKLLADLTQRDLTTEDAKTLMTGIGILTDKLILLESRIGQPAGSSAGLTEAERTEKLARVAVLLAKAGQELPAGSSIAVVEG